MIKAPIYSALIVGIVFISACANTGKPPIVTPAIDLERFMGDWFVIGSIPLSPEKNAYGGIESYQLVDTDRIDVTYTFRDGAFDGPEKIYTPTAKVVPGTGNATWKMQFIWPFQADYRIAYISDDYGETIIARNARDYVWLMARKPVLGPDRYEELLKEIEALGYDMKKFKPHPQREP